MSANCFNFWAQAPHRGFTPRPTGNLRFQDSLGYSPKRNFLVPLLDLVGDVWPWELFKFSSVTENSWQCVGLVLLEFVLKSTGPSDIFSETATIRFSYQLRISHVTTAMTYFMGVFTLVLKPSFSQKISLHRHLSLARADLECDHSVFGSH